MYIGLIGKAGSGKSTIARFLTEELGFDRVPFAGRLKAMARAFGLNEWHMNEGKEIPCDMLCGKTPREFMQWLGTEFGRKMIGEDVWLKRWQDDVAEIASDTFGPLKVVADDVRFQNECDLIRARGGIIIRVIRNGAGSKTGAGHDSERQELVPDFTIWNDGSITDLHEEVARVLRQVGAS